ncbi:MAG: hypothetical protein IKN04_19475, partial [Clostridia bacterium]|nr:hypothetical protein [Clostridia bacterium]
GRWYPSRWSGRALSEGDAASADAFQPMSFWPETERASVVQLASAFGRFRHDAHACQLHRQTCLWQLCRGLDACGHPFSFAKENQ